MKALVNGVSTIVNFVLSIVEMLFTFLELLWDSVSSVTSVLAFMPPYLLYGIVGVVTVAIVKTILSQGGSSA